jgi:hypothetical protein
MFPIHFEQGIEVDRVEVEESEPEIRQVFFDVALR